MSIFTAQHRQGKLAKLAASPCPVALVAWSCLIILASGIAGQDVRNKTRTGTNSKIENCLPEHDFGDLPELIFPDEPQPDPEQAVSNNLPKRMIKPLNADQNSAVQSDPSAATPSPSIPRSFIPESSIPRSFPSDNKQPPSRFPVSDKSKPTGLLPDEKLPSESTTATPMDSDPLPALPFFIRNGEPIGGNPPVVQKEEPFHYSRKPMPAEEPKMGERFFPLTSHSGDSGTRDSIYSPMDFSPDPAGLVPFDPWSEAEVFEGKYLNANQRPLLELGKPFYQLGQLPVSQTFLGRTNLMHPRFQVFGDFRTAVGFNGLDGNYRGVWGAVLNLEMDLRITATERFHALVAPLDRRGVPTRLEFDERQTTFVNNTDFEFDTGYFEGDLGALVGGAVDEVMPFDLPFTVGAIPLLYQNGIWLNDSFIGLAAAIPARNSPRLDISNFDVVFFWGIDNISSPAFQGDDDSAKMYGIQLFLETLNGYIESGYAFLEDRTALKRSYHNMTIAYSRRYGRWVSNSMRVLVNAGQNPNLPFKTADGVLLLMENSLITQYPSRVIPYCNLFAGFGRPQSVARQANAGGVLQNTGINFETDGVTNFPILDPTANDTFGAAVGINILAPENTQQIVLETAYLGVMGNDPSRQARGQQLGFGIRYQLPISNAVIFRADAMHGLRQNEGDLSGFRVELRHKF